MPQTGSSKIENLIVALMWGVFGAYMGLITSWYVKRRAIRFGDAFFQTQFGTAFRRAIEDFGVGYYYLVGAIIGAIVGIVFGLCCKKIKYN